MENVPRCAPGCNAGERPLAGSLLKVGIAQVLIPPPAVAIFQHAQDAWEARRLPAYVEFDVAIHHHYASGKDITGSEHVLLRTFDHWCRTREIDSDSPQVITSNGPACVGPARSPLGFNISAQYPASTQIDPFVGPLQTIAAVHALHYTVAFGGEEIVDGHRCYHLLLQPIGNPDYYPLRAVWADESTYDVRKLTYAMHQDGWSASIDYTFKPFPPNATWWIESIGAAWTPPPHDTADSSFTSMLQLTNVRFPGQAGAISVCAARFAEKCTTHETRHLATPSANGGTKP